MNLIFFDETLDHIGKLIRAVARVQPPIYFNDTD
jgi:hypothetical protein